MSQSLPEAQNGISRTALDDEMRAALASLEAAGAEIVSPTALQPADTLLDLYGEDIRARAYVTRDGVSGELMLRPDFTVPVVQTHLASGAETGFYAYGGPVWRSPVIGSGRPAEYLQVGFERFGQPDRARADAELFHRVAEMLDGRAADVATGDMGVLGALVAGLPTVAHRREALRRHLWRPERFRQLLDRFGPGHGRWKDQVSDILAIGREGDDAVRDAARSEGKTYGLRSLDDVVDRVRRLEIDADTQPLSAELCGLTEAVLAVAGPMGQALSTLRSYADDFSGLAGACDVIETRMEAMTSSGISAEALNFSTAFGRTSLEYYDGFVFGFFRHGLTDPVPVAQGGRYDQLVEVLGQGRKIPAVGAILRPEVLLA